VANVSHILFQEWHFWIRIPDVGRNAQRILITISQASFLGLRSLLFREVVQIHVVVSAAAVVDELHVQVAVIHAGCGERSAWFLVASFVDVVGLAKRVEIGSVAEEVRAVVCHILL